jgi:hypothetical protein
LTNVETPESIGSGSQTSPEPASRLINSSIRRGRPQLEVLGMADGRRSLLQRISPPRVDVAARPSVEESCTPMRAVTGPNVCRSFVHTRQAGEPPGNHAGSSIATIPV